MGPATLRPGAEVAWRSGGEGSYGSNEQLGGTGPLTHQQHV